VKVALVTFADRKDTVGALSGARETLSAHPGFVHGSPWRGRRLRCHGRLPGFGEANADLAAIFAYVPRD
jgi:hypothetical protein